MANLSDIWIKTETLQILLDTAKKKGVPGIALTLSTSDETNQYGQNVSAYVSQSKEDREAKKDRFYVGNGKLFWTDGKITKAEKKEKGNGPVSQPSDNSDQYPDELPF